MKSLVGYTGFVGSNIAQNGNFDNLYNSKNVEKGYGSTPDILVYAGVTGTKYIANKFPDQDLEIIESAKKNILSFSPKKLILISTIDVYTKPDGQNEDSEPNSTSDFVYGYHRKELEKWVMENVDDYIIVRLPGIYGKNIRKNFIFDMINPIPQALSEKFYKDFSTKEEIIKDLYACGKDGFYHHTKLNNIEEKELIRAFYRVKFTSLNFTDSRGVFQYYNLENLWNHLEIAIKNNLKILNIATEPFLISELYEYIYNKAYVNEISNNIPFYNLKTKYDYIFNGKDGYIYSKEQIMKNIEKFVTSYK